MAVVTICSDFGAQENEVCHFSLCPHLFVTKWWEQMLWCKFFECWGFLFYMYLFFNWKIIALQNFVVFCQISTWISHSFFTLLCHLYQKALSVQSLSPVRLCSPMDCSTSGLPVHHQVPEFTQTHVHWVSDVIQPSHPLSSPSPSAFNLSQHQVFPMSQFITSDGQSIGVSALVSVLPMNIHDWFPLGWTGWISLQSKGLSRVFSTSQFKSINSSVLNFLYRPAVTSIHDYCKNHSLDKMDLFWQSNVSAF